jgi:alginate O-acetyltransferase complex protein AlgI
MLDDPQLFLIFIVVAATFFWVIPSQWPRARQWSLIGASVAFLFTIAPVAVVLATFSTLVAVASSHVWSRTRSTGASLVILFCILAALPLLGLRLSPEKYGLVVALGIAFTTLRAIGMVVHGYQTRERIALADAALLMSFFPTFSSGPIEILLPFRAENLPTSVSWRVVVNGLVRIAWGIFKVAYVCNVLIWPNLSELRELVFADAYTGGAGLVLTFTFLNLAFIYINFSAYSDIAIGAGHLFGFDIIENFNLPFLATNIVEFWQRWHISLGRWVTMYIYMPLVRNYGAVYISIVLAFLFVGAWHDFTVNYIIWGLGHGMALAATQYVKRRNAPRNRRVPRRGAAAVAEEASAKQPVPAMLGGHFGHKTLPVLGWAFTMTYVAVLSAFANAKSLEEGLQYLSRLVGIG